MPAIKDDHACKLRRFFDTKAKAQAAAYRIAASNGKHRLPESCGFCRGWHLGAAQ